MGDSPIEEKTKVPAKQENGEETYDQTHTDKKQDSPPSTSEPTLQEDGDATGHVRQYTGSENSSDEAVIPEKKETAHVLESTGTKNMDQTEESLSSHKLDGKISGKDAKEEEKLGTISEASTHINIQTPSEENHEDGAAEESTDKKEEGKKPPVSPQEAGNNPSLQLSTNGNISSQKSEQVGEKRKNPHFDDKKRFKKHERFSAEQRKTYRQNIKAKFDNLPPSTDPEEIRHQVEFYFSDSNLPTDEFLFNAVGGVKNNPVPIKTIHSFKRMRRFQPYSVVVEALKQSDFLEIVNEDSVRRKVPIPIESRTRENIRTFTDSALPRSIYAKGFGTETESTHLEIEQFFSKFGTIRCVRLRRTYPHNIFKGSVFVEFESESDTKKFLDLDPKPKWNDTQELLIMGKKEYCEMKLKDIEEGKVKRNGKKRPRLNNKNSAKNRSQPIEM